MNHYKVIITLVLALSRAVPPAASVFMAANAQEAVVNGSITGRVVTHYGHGIDNALVKIVNSSGGQNVNYEATTDASGNFIINGVTPGVYTLTASRNDCGSTQGVVDITGPDTAAGNVVIKTRPYNMTLSADDASIKSDWEDYAVLKANVTDVFGEPVGEGYNVTFFSNEDRYFGRLKTSPDGFSYGKKAVPTDADGCAMIYFGWGMYNGDKYVNATLVENSSINSSLLIHHYSGSDVPSQQSSSPPSIHMWDYYNPNYRLNPDNTYTMPTPTATPVPTPEPPTPAPTPTPSPVFSRITPTPEAPQASAGGSSDGYAYFFGIALVLMAAAGGYLLLRKK